ncbi:anti-sigma factor family protein [Xanthobacter agilis]|uniref:anti-sigma factor family protein n=1 Tax=Xanthobacter agilis TaxID=47492 RepID=UPI0037299FCF
MSKDPATRDEAQIQAFIYGRLDAAARERMAATLAADPALAAEVALDQAHADTLRRQLAAIAEAPIPHRLRLDHLRARRRERQWRHLRAVAAGVALLATGAIGGWLAARSAPVSAPGAVMTVATEAATAYRTFVVEVAHPVEVDTAREAHLLQWLSKRLGRPLAAPDLTRFGYRLMGGRLLPGSGGAAAQLMYDDPSGRRLTLYVEASRGGQTAFRFHEDGEAGTFAWIDQGFGFAVTGPIGREALLPIAEAVYQRFEDPPPAGAARL